MKTMLKFFTLSVAIFAFSTISFGQNTDNATATAGARIVTPLTIENDEALEFGDIISGANTVTITADGERTATNTELCLLLHRALLKPPNLQLKEKPGLAYTVLISEI
ncbi:MAG: hypothetical protein ACOXZJ_02180 [Bacteroidales bacterium]